MDKKKVERARERVRKGYYDGPKVIEVVVDKIIKDLGGHDDEEPRAEQ